MITSVSTDNIVQGPQNTHHGEETQAPDWANPEDWGELYDLWEDPQENVNLYRFPSNFGGLSSPPYIRVCRDDSYHDTKLELRKMLHQGWTQHNY